MNDETGSAYDTNFSTETAQHVIWKMGMTQGKLLVWYTVGGPRKKKDFFLSSTKI